ncbi:Glycoside hydrolase family 5 protein [Mycena indigotica]|uniref:glucan 1,3-beta-glucosidase n=1 Tax=Mycena indigotica TaxID=2126181 RepID=A0A8H6WBY3_9AGAR|nr:Glycoside hydrolase family 5 protein [Mycena indigotica]KAF7312287.1 Glycoside hydrolase family 5 protein [Mycena indigotica]
MTHVPYPSTPGFNNFKVDYVRALDRAMGDGPRPPTRATFFGTVKLHGSNATIVFRNGNKTAAQIQSRSWIIESTKKDNCGTFALLSKAPLHRLVEQILKTRQQGDAFTEIYICGEIAGKGVQKGVAITQLERFFAIFNIRVDGHWVDLRQYKDCALPEHRIYNVAQYKTFEVDIDFRAPTTQVHDLMQKYTAEVYLECPFGHAFVDAAGKSVSGNGEGIVWTMVRSPFLDEENGRGFDDTLLCNFKTKGETFSTTAYQPKAKIDPAMAELASDFAKYALGERRLEQGIEYLESEQAREGQPQDGYNLKLTGAFIKFVTEDAIREERNEMLRLGVAEKDAKREVGARAKACRNLMTSTWSIYDDALVAQFSLLCTWPCKTLPPPLTTRAMELHVVYRILRKISEWASVDGYYFSEVYVNGEQSVPKNTPIILTPSHHNELLDVGLLAATIPHRRMVSFWAKSTTFKHPVLGPILESSGAIPVRRNPNKADAAASNAALFDASTAALGRKQALGVFPEGTSYTEPEISQVLSGAAWAALEYMRSRGDGQPVIIIPVGIVYEDKAKYRSRVRVEYGHPIDMTQYMPPSLFESDDLGAEREVVKDVMREVEEQLRGLTINAADWETLYAARMTRNILWTDDSNIKMKDWLAVSQTLVKLFSSPDDGDSELCAVKRSLTKYFSLLHYTNITHGQLASLAPNTFARPGRWFVLRFCSTFLRTILNPSFILFIPPLIAHTPAYLLANLTSYLAPPGEEESRSQFKVFLGGFGTGLGAGLSSYWTTKFLSSRFVIDGGLRSRFALWSLTAWLIIQWHVVLINRGGLFLLVFDWRLRHEIRLKRLGAAFKIMLGMLQPRTWDLPLSKLTSYERPPIPATNPFLKNQSSGESLGGKAWLKAQPPSISPRRMVLLLTDAAQQCHLRPHNQILTSLGSTKPTTSPAGASSKTTASNGAPTPSGSATPAPPTPFNYGTTPIRGVNLGGWLVLEPWITPSIFNNTRNDAIIDEYTFGQMQDAQTALNVLQKHWDTWITEDDFKAIAAAGLNHVRIPVGYWSVPLTSSDTHGNTSPAPYVAGAWPYLLKALNWARQHSVHVIIDLHGAPGSQNGFDNSGQRTSNAQFMNNPANITRTIDTLRFIVENIGGMIDVIELLNEPATFLSDNYPSVLRQFWKDGYSAVRDAVGTGLRVMIGDGFQGVDSWTNFLTYPSATGVLMDYHEYQIFSVPELARSFDDHISFACGSMADLTSFAKNNIWTVVGEWSNAPTDCALWLNGRGIGARWDGTWYTPNTPFGSCTGWTGPFSTFSSDYKTFLRKWVLGSADDDGREGSGLDILGAQLVLNFVASPQLIFSSQDLED